MIRFSNFSGTNFHVASAGKDFLIPPGFTFEFETVSVTGVLHSGNSRILAGPDSVSVFPETSRSELFGMGFGLGLACVATAVIFSLVKSIASTRQIFD